MMWIGMVTGIMMEMILGMVVGMVGISNISSDGLFLHLA